MMALMKIVAGKLGRDRRRVRPDSQADRGGIATAVSALGVTFRELFKEPELSSALGG
jgi:hypothetical protein